MVIRAEYNGHICDSIGISHNENGHYFDLETTTDDGVLERYYGVPISDLVIICGEVPSSENKPNKSFISSLMMIALSLFASGLLIIIYNFIIGSILCICAGGVIGYSVNLIMKKI